MPGGGIKLATVLAVINSRQGSNLYREVHEYENSKIWIELIFGQSGNYWSRKRYGGRHTNLLKFGQLIFKKIIKIVATRRQI